MSSDSWRIVRCLAFADFVSVRVNRDEQLSETARPPLRGVANVPQSVESNCKMAHETETSAAELLGNAFAAAAAAVFLTTPERVITAANAAAYAMLGYTPPKLAGRQQRMIYAASDDYVIVDAIIMSDASASANAAVPITLRDIRGARLTSTSSCCPFATRVRLLPSSRS